MESSSVVDRDRRWSRISVDLGILRAARISRNMWFCGRLDKNIRDDSKNGRE